MAVAYTSGSGVTGSGTSVTAQQVSVTCNAGDTLIVFVKTNNGSSLVTPSSVTFTNGGTAVSLGTGVSDANLPSYGSMFAYSIPVTSTGTGTLTANTSSANVIIDAAAYSGVSSITGYATNAATNTSVSVSTTNSGGLMVGSFNANVNPQAATLTSGTAQFAGAPLAYSSGSTLSWSCTFSSNCAIAFVLNGVAGPGSGSPTSAVVPNPRVGPMALRQAYQRRPQAQANIVGLTSPDSSTLVSAGLLAAGAVSKTVGDSGNTVTVGLTAVGVIGESASTPDVLTVGLLAAGSAGAASGALVTAVVGLTSAGAVGELIGAPDVLTVGLSAGGTVGDVTGGAFPTIVGLTAGGLVVAPITPGATVSVTAGLSALGTAAVGSGGVSALSAVLAATGFIIGYEGGGSQIVALSGSQIVRRESRTQVVGFESRVLSVKRSTAVSAVAVVPVESRVTVVSRRETRLVSVVK